MSEDGSAWASGLGLPEDTVTQFETVAREFNLSAADMVGMLVAQVIKMDADLNRVGPHNLGFWRTKEDITGDLIQAAVRALPVEVRPTGCMWPPDRPFPWSADECLAAVIGYEVRWRGTADEFLMYLRGRWELTQGHAVLHQS